MCKVDRRLRLRNEAKIGLSVGDSGLNNDSEMLVKIVFSGSKNGKIASARPNHGGPRRGGALRAPRRLWRRLPQPPG